MQISSQIPSRSASPCWEQILREAALTSCWKDRFEHLKTVSRGSTFNYQQHRWCRSVLKSWKEKQTARGRRSRKKKTTSSTTESRTTAADGEMLKLKAARKTRRLPGATTLPLCKRTLFISASMRNWKTSKNLRWILLSFSFVDALTNGNVLYGAKLQSWKRSDRIDRSSSNAYKRNKGKRKQSSLSSFICGRYWNIVWRQSFEREREITSLEKCGGAAHSGKITAVEWWMERPSRCVDCINNDDQA